MSISTDPARVASSGDRPVGGAWKRFVPMLGAIGLLMVVIIVLGPPATGPTLDPDSPRESGLLGVVRLLEELEVDVQISLEPTAAPRADGASRAFVPIDLLSTDLREPWLEWMDDGGTLIVAGPSALHQLQLVEGPLSEAFAPTEREPGCDLPSLELVGQSEHDAWIGVDAPPDAITCFASSGGAPWLVQTQQGQGQLIVLGSADPFTNRWLDEADNAVLAAALLGPNPGAAVTLVPRPSADERDTTLGDLVPGGVWRALALLAIAGVVAVIARARRLGPPVAERLPPVLPSAELARSLAGLTQRAGDRAGAAAKLRARAWERATRSLGLPRTTDPEVVIARMGRVVAVPTDDLQRALVPSVPNDDDDLVAVARSVATVLFALERPSSTSHDPTSTTLGAPLDPQADQADQ